MPRKHTFSIAERKAGSASPVETHERAAIVIELLTAISTAAAGADNFGHILTVAIEHLSRVCPCTAGAIALAEEDQLLIRAAVGPFAAGKPGQHTARDAGPFWQAIMTGKPLVADGHDVAGLQLLGPAHSYLAAPLIWHGHAFGLLVLAAPEPDAFDSNAVALVQQVAVGLSGLIELARLHEAERSARLIAETAQRRFRDLVQGLDAIVWEGDPHTLQFTFVSQRAEALLGYPVARWLAEPDFWINSIHPDDRTHIGQQLRMTVQEARDHTFEYRALAADDRVIWLRCDVTVICDAAGHAQQLRGLMVDVSERKRVETAQQFLAEASGLLATSLDYETTLRSVARLAVPYLADWCAVHVLEEDGSIRRLAVAHVDPAKEELVRDRPARYPLDSHARYIVPSVLRTGRSELVPEVSDELLVAAARDEAHLKTLRGLGFTSYISVPLIAHGRPLGTITLVTSESGRRYTQDDLTLAEDLARRAALAVDNAWLYREAQEAIRARDQFLSIASHELKTPITSLLGFTQLLQRRTEREGTLGERTQRAVRVIGEQAQRLNQLVALMLNLSRIETGQLSIERAPLDLHALTQRVVDEMQPLLERHTVTITGPDTPLIVEADELRLEQVLQNLIQNAIKYSPAGGPIMIHVVRQADHACLAISDQGIGIPEEARAHLFQRFYRASNVDPRQISGMGIGLYVVKEIVRRHGGTVEVRSEEGRGSTFTVRLPLNDTTYALSL